MSLERNKDIIRQLIQAHVRSDAARAGEILSPKLKWHMAGQADVLDRAAYVGGIEMGARAFAGIQNQELSLVAEGDKVTLLSRWRMRHVGEFDGIPATDREVAFRSLWMYAIVEGRVVEIWSFDEDFTPQLR
jgi:predicted ester cyclase